MGPGGRHSRATGSRRIDPIAAKIQALFPNPNVAGSAGANVGGVNTSRNYVQPADRNFDRNNYDLKVNWNFSPQTQVWGKYSRMGASVDSPQAYLGYEPPTISGDTTVNQYTFGTTWTMNATTVFDATYGISKMTHESIAGDAALGNFGLDELGIHGTNGGANFSSDPRYAGHADVPHRASRPSGTPMHGCPCSATSAPTRSPAT